MSSLRSFLLMTCLGLAEITTGQIVQGVCFSGPPEQVGDTCIAHVQTIGAEWICFIPYAFGPDASGRLLFDQGDRQWWGERPDGIRVLVGMAKARGMKVMLKPHLWLGHGEFTGTFSPTDGDWRAFEASYADYILLHAKLARELDVDLFCIGTEMDRFVQQRTAFWQILIDKVSNAFQGPLTYAANWDEVARFPLWKRLDHIGVDGYFPICAEASPAVHELEAGWRVHVDRLRGLSERMDRPVLFTEMGYCCSTTCAVEPWKEDRNALRDEAAQARAYRAFFNVFASESWYSGCFVWKWFADGGVREERHGPGFSPQNKQAMHVLRSAFAAP